MSSMTPTHSTAAGARTAEIAANETANKIGFKARHVVDTEYGQPCWLAYEQPNCAIVYYDDNPHCQVSTGNKPGRFINAALAKTGGAK